MAQRGADAIRPGVAAADDDDVLARGGNGGAIGVAVEPMFGLAVQKFHGEMDALQVPAFDGQIARLGRAGAEHDGVKFPQQIFRRIIFPDLGVGDEIDAFRRHLIDAALDQFFVQLHVGDAVHEQAAKTVGPFVNRDEMAGAIELGGGAKPGRAGADDRNFFAGARVRRFGLDPAFLPALVGDGAFDVFNGDGRRGDAEHTRAFAGRGADAAGEIGEIIGFVQPLQGLAPQAAIDQIVPFRNEVVDRAAGGHAADAECRYGKRECRNPCNARPAGAVSPRPDEGEIRSNPDAFQGGAVQRQFPQIF